MPHNPKKPRPKHSTYNVFASSMGATHDLRRNADHLNHFAVVLQGGRVAQSIDQMERATAEITRILGQMTLVNSTIAAMIQRARVES